MPFSSPYPPLNIAATNVLDYIFPAEETPSDQPIWIDSQDTSKSLSPRQALQWTKQTAFGLTRLGLQQGDVVVIYSTNHIFVPAAYYGIVGGGFVFSGVNPAYTVKELVYQMSNLNAKVLLVEPDFLEAALEAAPQAGLPRSHIFQFADRPVPTRSGIPDWRAGLLGTPAESDGYRWPQFSPEASRAAVATVNFSSGTTGLPKGVCISHASLVANCEQTIALRYAEKPFAVADRPPERFVGFLPLYHAFGQSWVFFLGPRLGIPTYVMRAFPRFRLAALLEAVQRFRVTTLQVPPPVLAMLCKREEGIGGEDYDLSSLREVICGAAPLGRELQNEAQRRLGVQVIQGWGMTEVTCCGCLVPGGVPDERGSVGVLAPGTEGMLVDEEGREVEAEEEQEQGEGKGSGRRTARGELWVRGPQVMLRYWRNEAATRETLGPDGWLRTGDVCVVDDKGWIWIVDRKKELIKVNALQVAPAELEQMLLENEHISDAAVVGITLDDNEWPRAYCSIQPASRGKVKPEHVQEWIKPRVAKHKQLAGGVVFVDEVPRLPSGKIQRKVMKEWAKRDAEALKRAGKTVSRSRI